MINTFYEDRAEAAKQNARMANIGCLAVFGFFAVWGSVVFGIGYTVVHFIKKLW